MTAATTIRTTTHSAPIAPAAAALVNAGLAIVSVNKTKVATGIVLAATLLSGASLCFTAKTPFANLHKSDTPARGTTASPYRPA